MRKYVCSICGFEYDPLEGLPDSGIAPGTSFADLPDGFSCPLCGAGKESFEAAEASLQVEQPPAASATIAAVIARTPTVKSLRLAPDNPIVFAAGQYLQLAFGDEAALTRCLSISSSPTESGYLEVTKRITASRFSELLNQARPGDRVNVSGPFGSFILDERDHKAAFLSGGIGITPLRSMCRCAADRRLDVNICLVYSNRTPEEIAFAADFEELQSRCSSLKVVHTLSRAGDDWRGRRGRIDAALVANEVPDYLERRFYVCGPPEMVEALRRVLLDMLVPEPRILTESFLGY